ncbi:MAG: hypothetical protein NTW21_31565 [Verrucomicrobia bacterium]|nr:hypothetical protein [Verrucomicrobiota bacterium]
MKSKRLLSALAALLIVETGTAQTTFTWTNTVGGTYNWTDASNWNPAAVPDPVAGDEIYFNIPNGSSGIGITLNLEADRTAEKWRYVATGGFDPKELKVTNTGGYKVILAGTTPTLHSSEPAPDPRP